MKKTEARIQSEIVKSFRNKLGTRLNDPKCLIFSVPNERENRSELRKMIGTGLLSGVSDLIVIIPGRVLFVEVKDDKGKQSESQLEFEKDVNRLGFEYILVRSVAEFWKKSLILDA